MKTKIIKTKTLSKKYSLLLLFLICFTINIKAQYVEQKLGNDVEHSELRLNSIFANYGIANYYGILEIRAGSFGNGAPLLSIHPYNQQVRIPGTLLVGTSTHINNTIAHFDGRVYISEKDGTEQGLGNINDNKYKDFLLWVEEGIVSADFAVAELTDWPDYVFSKDYNLLSLKDVEKNIKEKGHLHTMPSAEFIEKNGFTLTDISKRIVKTIEELTLHTINQEKQIESQNILINNLMNRLNALEAKLK